MNGDLQSYFHYVQAVLDRIDRNAPYSELRPWERDFIKRSSQTVIPSANRTILTLKEVEQLERLSDRLEQARLEHDPAYTPLSIIREL